MSTLLLLVIVAGLYVFAYNTYGKFLGSKIFQLKKTTHVPAKQFKDNKDFIPTKKDIVFGHHFTSIAGTGPIVGPAIGVIWGWVPAVLWIVIGSIFMGAVHDLASTVMSVKNDGKSLIKIAEELVGKKIKWIFFAIVFIALWIVIAIFGLVIALIFKQFPSSVLPVFAEIPIAIGLGYALSKNRAYKTISGLLAKIAFLSIIIFGVFFPIELPVIFGIPSTGTWTLILLSYAFIASLMPINKLMQPRDYLNAWQLYILMGLISIGILFAATLYEMPIVAPAINLNPQGAPPIWPFLFITIACGAISGFHSLVASGTTSKQIENEADALPIGYGAMLLEGMLAIIVIIAVSAGVGLGYENLTGNAAWFAHYGSWASSSGLGTKLSAVVIGSSNILNTIGIPKSIGIVLMGVFIASFAGTTLDTSTRIQRYVISETLKTSSLIATLIAVLSGAVLAFSSGADGKGALLLWPLFGAVNQLLAALALLVATLYLKKKGGKKYIVTLIPFIIMITITLWATVHNQLLFISNANILLSLINCSILVLSIWMIVEGLKKCLNKFS